MHNSPTPTTHDANEPQAQTLAAAGVYLAEAPPEFVGALDHLDALKLRIDACKPIAPALWETVQQKLRIDWTYHSNALEGSTLNRGETHFFLTEGLTVEGKPLKDFIDARNHAEAIDFLAEVVRGERAITEGLIKEINALLLAGVRSTPALDQFGRQTEKKATPGQYKSLPNHVLQADGTIHRYVDPAQVAPQMETLVAWIAQALPTRHPVLVAAVAHYNLVRIHPFDDGNGRGARILMNLILMKRGFPPAIVRQERRRAYLEALAQADSGQMLPFLQEIALSLAATMDGILADLSA